MKKYPSNYSFCDQNSPEWLMLRIGQVTASRVKDVVGKLKKGGETAARASYKLELLTEVLTGRATDHFVSLTMDFGKENEPLARTCYELERGVEVERVGYVRHASIQRAGCSPDGLVGEDGLVEFKVPNTTTHLEYLIADVVPEEYKPQMMWQMACTGRLWCDYVSYDPRLPADFGLFIKRFERDEEAICQMEKEVETFIAELNQMCEKLLKGKSVPTVGQTAAPGPPRAQLPDWQPVSDSVKP
jgi:YqaJ-like viral recombinase domain